MNVNMNQRGLFSILKDNRSKNSYEIHGLSRLVFRLISQQKKTEYKKMDPADYIFLSSITTSKSKKTAYDEEIIVAKDNFRDL